jgi:hypothetical protein
MVGIFIVLDNKCEFSINGLCIIEDLYGDKYVFDDVYLTGDNYLTGDV